MAKVEQAPVWGDSFLKSYSKRNVYVMARENGGHRHASGCVLSFLKNIYLSLQLILLRQ
jgi:hypothetical protein